MNLHLEAAHVLRWLHIVAMATGGGAAVVALLLSGFEEGREDLRGLAATVWAKVVAWAFRLAVVFGALLLVVLLQKGDNPFVVGRAFSIKLVLALILLGLSEMTPKALAAGKRGSALLVVVLFLTTTFVMYNQGLFVSASQVLPASQVIPPPQATAGPQAH